MKVLITGGQNEADFIIKMFKEEKHQIIVVNKDQNYCKYLSKENRIKVYIGDPTQISVLNEAGAMECDLAIALCQRDEDNFVVCQIAKKIFGIEKVVCTVSNPKNVDIFHKMGINSVVSSTFLLLQTIKAESSLENVVKALSLEQDKIAMLEIVLNNKELAIIGKTLAQLENTRLYNISCIYRNAQVVIPSGNTEIKFGDKLFVITTNADKEEVIKYIQKKTKRTIND